ncbi:DUF3619 family protein [Ampullimonas aquatilis]|uniref:DUF3619 family protein n=1 Tax=Ampullimonas aquatilis TaxID=1341549 RepID=UPI003C76A793
MNPTSMENRRSAAAWEPEFDIFTERQLGEKIRQVLDDSASSLPPTISQKLAKARQEAISRKRSSGLTVDLLQTQLAGNSGRSSGSSTGGWFGKLGFAIPVLLLACTLLIVQDWGEMDAADEAADIDTALLSDELPIDAYMDRGFTSFLNTADQPSAGTAKASGQDL